MKAIIVKYIYMYDILFIQQLFFLRVVAGFPASRPLRVSYAFAQVETIAFMPQRKLLLGSVNHGKSYGKPSQNGILLMVNDE